MAQLPPAPMLEPVSTGSSKTPARAKGRTSKAVAKRPRATALLQELGDVTERLKQEGRDRRASAARPTAAIMDVVDMVSTVIHGRLDEIATLGDHLDREAAEFVRRMDQDGTFLQQRIEQYVRQCVDIQRQIKDAGKMDRRD
jgi:hypothetical protein